MDKTRTKDASEGVAPAGIAPLDNALSNQPESRYECPICLNWLHEPVITTCGHRFCKACISSWLQTSGHCPIDNINLIMKVDIFPDNYTRREIQEQRMSCPFAPKGCRAKVAPLEIDAHIASCEFNQPEPSNSDSKVPCTFQNLGCKDMFECQEDLAKHIQEATQSHMSLLMNAYSELRISRDMSGGGGGLDGKEQEAMSLWEPDKNSNTSQLGADSTSALIRALYERVVILEQRNREQDIALANMSKQVCALTVAKRKQASEMTLRYCLGEYVWRIDGFRARLDAMTADHAKMLYSPGFYTSPHGYRFCARLNISPHNPQYVALHLHLMRSEWDGGLDWPFTGRISIAMVHARDPARTQRDTMMSNSELTAFRRPTAEICLRGFGYTEYALVADVLRGGFVHDDTLTFRLSIKCV